MKTFYVLCHPPPPPPPQQHDDMEVCKYQSYLILITTLSSKNMSQHTLQLEHWNIVFPKF